MLSKSLRTCKILKLERHGIFHHATTQSKLRVVFACAARFNNTSLNEQLLEGPDFTNNLVGVLIRFRPDQYAFTCDIKSMFHQINVSPFDSNYLRFLWWPNHDLNCTPVDYHLGMTVPKCCRLCVKKGS